jgi:hypothetical protein
VLLYLRKKVLRGALTNGHDWIFLLIKINDNYESVSYQKSNVLQTKKDLNGQLVITKPWPDLIAAILSHWVSLVLNCIVELFTDLDTRWEMALQTLEVMIGLNQPTLK